MPNSTIYLSASQSALPDQLSISAKIVFMTQIQRSASKRSTAIAQSIVRKLSVHKGSRKKHNDRPIASPGPTGTGMKEPSVAIDQDQASVMSHPTSDTTRTSETTKSTTRYTITSRSTNPLSADSGVSSSASTVVDSESAIPLNEGLNHFHKPSYTVPVTTFTSHQGETAQIQLPPVGEDLKSRLEGLKQFKQWSERIHDSSGKTTKEVHKPEGRHEGSSASLHRDPSIDDTFRHLAGHNTPVSIQQPLRLNQDLPLRHDSDIVETNIEAPTPFSTPHVTPMPINKIAHVADTNYATSPPAWDLHAGGRSRATSRTLVIASTPIATLERRSRSRSKSQSTTTARAASHTRDKKYPPCAFPKDFEQSTDSGQAAAVNVSDSPEHVNPRVKTPSISPFTKSTTKDDQQSTATPHDKRGRPVFYNTIHYNTECSHASPPATRRLDPEAQPRTDPDFQPFNPTITRSIIPGRCFNCDTSYRRQQENAIVEASASRIAELEDQLAGLTEELEISDAEYSSDEEGNPEDRHAALLHTPSSFPEDDHDLRHQLSSLSLPPLSDDDALITTERRMRGMTTDDRAYQARLLSMVERTEAVVGELRNSQEDKVKAVWQGFTKRWGPATLGVQRGFWTDTVEKYRTKEDHKDLLEHERRSIEKPLTTPDDVRADVLQVTTPIVV